MIELKGKKTFPIQTSSFVLCITNYNDSSAIVVAVDLKTRRKTIFKTYKCQYKPSFLFEVDDNNIFIGTEGGFLEHWHLVKHSLVKSYECHSGSLAGISSIIEI